MAHTPLYKASPSQSKRQGRTGRQWVLIILGVAALTLIAALLGRGIPAHGIVGDALAANDGVDGVRRGLLGALHDIPVVKSVLPAPEHARASVAAPPDVTTSSSDSTREGPWPGPVSSRTGVATARGLPILQRVPDALAPGFMSTSNLPRAAEPAEQPAPEQMEPPEADEAPVAPAASAAGMAPVSIPEPFFGRVPAASMPAAAAGRITGVSPAAVTAMPQPAPVAVIMPAPRADDDRIRGEAPAMIVLPQATAIQPQASAAVPKVTAVQLPPPGLAVQPQAPAAIVAPVQSVILLPAAQGPAANQPPHRMPIPAAPAGSMTSQPVAPPAGPGNGDNSGSGRGGHGGHGGGRGG